ncbi:cytochrome c oxidase accessory protein CcoG [Helicobacter pylori]|uniref:cytochrome c oxidase accessory protein CcoG n=1 Tax=Helicobacter pylori TaxID=210 RepID=UPI0009A3C1E0|nr:cytochrome c oxidase accessory protein CcoG [Helicobacter pylori]MBH0288489.1 cytochrome c oxidase accessory protein CcoG [Helicobacter pylori]NHA21709.1 cytochrome c oxidase accessory protein CcoG [Helicobacter pylori]OPG51762.1 cytochrome c oxidase accessory protein CcoG [Helicobacter pylori]
MLESSSHFLKSFRLKRYIGFLLISLALLITPFVRIDGAHLFLISFEHKQLHFLGKIFSAEELQILPFMVILLFIGIFFITTSLGRVWCGWACPQTFLRVLYRDVIETKIFKLHKKISNKQESPKNTPSYKIRKALSVLLFAPVVAGLMMLFFFYFIAPEDFFMYLKNPSDHPIAMGFWLFSALVVLFDIVVVAERFCIYLCPYARVQSVLYDNDTLNPIYDEKRGGVLYDNQGRLFPLPPKKRSAENECVNCLHCVQVCPTHIDIRKGLQLECINCLECVDACTITMAKYNRPSLIQWSSTNATNTRQKVRLVRLKTIAYMGVIAIVVALLAITSFKKERMLLDINRNSDLYELRSSGYVDNDYVFLFHNTDNKDHEFYFKILGQKDIHIKKPLNPIAIKAGQKIKAVVILRKPLKGNATEYKRAKDILIPIMIQAYSADDKNITIERESVFIAPSED